MGNCYHVLYEPPALEEEDMPVVLESLATMLIESGLLRIDGGDKMNFVRFAMPYDHFEVMFSARQLYDTKHVSTTKNLIAEKIRHSSSPGKRRMSADSELRRLKDMLGKYHPISLEEERKIARLLAQSMHPSVLLLVLYEQVEVFVSYCHTVGDMLDVKSWKFVGSSGGLQRSDGRKSAVFVSTGGDPFRVPDKEGLHYGDGPPAMSRLMVIAGQEFGHFADIQRDASGNHVGRFSSNIYGTRAYTNVIEARYNDLRQINRTLEQLYRIGFKRLRKWEKEIKFYEKHKFRFVRRIRLYGYVFILKWIFMKRAANCGLEYIASLKHHKLLGSALNDAIKDTRFNLEPKASAYERSSAHEQEAIYCIEALARVPQQAIKWGHPLTEALMSGLYRIYYEEVIPACITTCEVYSGREYTLEIIKPQISFSRKLLRKFKKNLPNFLQRRM